jgi:hypothetical protein
VAEATFMESVVTVTAFVIQHEEPVRKLIRIKLASPLPIFSVKNSWNKRGLESDKNSIHMFVLKGLCTQFIYVGHLKVFTECQKH